MADKRIITGGTILTPTGVINKGYILISEGKIREVGKDEGNCFDCHEVIDASDFIVSPGFIDIHIHGRWGYDIMQSSENPEVLKKLCERLPETGVTSWMPTTLTASLEDTSKVWEAINNYSRKPLNGAEIIGIYSEGIYFNPKYAGAQNPEFIREVELEEIKTLLESGKGMVKIFSLAPELEKADEVVEYLASHDIVPSMGHTDATFNKITACVNKGLSHVTHLYNGMRPMHHLELGAAGGGLTMNDLTSELICDGLHLTKEIICLTFKVKPIDRIILISESVWAAGLPDGDYSLSGVDIIKEGEKLLVASKDYSLAGSCLSLDMALQNAMNFTGIPIEKLIKCITINAARQAGVHSCKGSIEVGKDADIVLLDTKGSVQSTYVNGKCVFQSKRQNN
jgi:N-acetylglucosamine-6-phosphate deacetylase